MSGYVNSLAQLDAMDKGDWEDLIDWTLVENDTAQVG